MFAILSAFGGVALHPVTRLCWESADHAMMGILTNMTWDITTVTLVVYPLIIHL